ncbi:MAG: hypothetical protein PHW10_05155 [Candidatus Peribacteraceae bacterium]|nr:hypothetical protein [Candidatus Peribacteraceae bacterium]
MYPFASLPIMCGGIAILVRSVPSALLEREGLQLIGNAGADESMLLFHYRDPVPRLPALHGEDLDIFSWGNRNDKESRLPRTGWCKAESLEAGKWQWLHPEEVLIPAVRGVEKGVWFPVANGIRGVLVRDEGNIAHVYMLTQAASPDYLAMTKHERMPVFA